MTFNEESLPRPNAGLVLPGGGARGAYQVGVLKAISDLLPDAPNPFPVIVGVSVGAINAAAIACHACNYKAAVKHLVELWSNIHACDVYRTDLQSVSASGLRWLLVDFWWLRYRKSKVVSGQCALGETSDARARLVTDRDAIAKMHCARWVVTARAIAAVPQLHL
jgi:predicted acylesterase/phospholipase RssA